MKLSKKYKVVLDSDVTPEIEKIDGKTIISFESKSVEIFEDVPELNKRMFGEFIVLKREMCD